VIEGRDIGSVVCPDAEVKVYLDAESGVRVRRRVAERPGSDERALAADLRVRDERDAPQTQPAPDAERIDTTDLTVDEVIERIAALVAARPRA
jgi:cytidylate kinase